MKDRKALLSAIVLGLPFAVASPSLAGSDPTGVWLNDTGRGAIEIKDCGGGAMCGHVVWTRDTTDVKGCGKQIIGSAQPVSGGLWDNGWIYSPEKKRKYDVELKPLADGTLRVKGYAGTKLFSKTMIWTPAPADLVRCDATQEAKADPATPDAAKPSDAKAADAKPAGAAAAAAPPGPEKQVAAKPAETPKPEPSKETPQVETSPPAAKDAAPPAEDAEPKVAEAAPADDESEGGRKSGDLDFGNGYGFKEVGRGKCRLNVPYVTITIDCPK